MLLSFKNIISIEQIKKPLRRMKSFVSDLPLHWGERRYCPVCRKTSGRFGVFGVVPRQDARCVWCGALERHRFVWLYFAQKTDLFDGRPKKLLHVAPEPAFEKRFKEHREISCFTADLFDRRVMIKMDIANSCFFNETFDVIYCSHVLEGVPNDKQAIREYYRVLKKDSWAIILVPITAKKTFEDPSITDLADRVRLFGQVDRVRRYGTDFVERLREASFEVCVIAPDDFLSETEIERMGIGEAAGEIFYCKKGQLS